MEKLIYQKFILGVAAQESAPLAGEVPEQTEFGRRRGVNSELDIALSKGLGGVIFFTKDIQSRDQFKNLIAEIKQKSLIPPFLSIDQEGGRVERTENIHARYLSPRFAFERGEDFLVNQTEKIAKELCEYGINLNFAPCADVNTNPKNPIIGERAFSDNTEDVIKGVKLVSKTYRKNGIIPCIKHFPGHGDASADSHLTLPVIDLPMSEMEEIHIRPFKENLDVEMIMAAHLHCTCFNEERMPASLSANAIGYLRKVLGYNGVIISDDMVMKGVQDFGSVEACIMAIKAGVDMFIYRDADELAISTIEGVLQEVERDEELQRLVLDSDKRIQRLKKERLG